MSNSKLGELLFMDTAHCDIVFVVEAEEIPGHRAAFAASCPYFDKLLYGDFKESKSAKVEITETSAKIFKEIRRYVYLGCLEIAEWKIEDLLELLSVAHEYQYKVLFGEVMNAVKKQPLDFNSWSLVNSTAAIYDSESLRAKCVSFAETEIHNFLSNKNMDKVTEEFLCVMFDTPKIRTVNQDQLLRSLLQWNKTHHSAQIKSLYEKICWTKLSRNSLEIYAKLFFLNLKNEVKPPPAFGQNSNPTQFQFGQALQQPASGLQFGAPAQLPAAQPSLAAPQLNLYQMPNFNFGGQDSAGGVFQFEASGSDQVNNGGDSIIHCIIRRNIKKAKRRLGRP